MSAKKDNGLKAALADIMGTAPAEALAPPESLPEHSHGKAIKGPQHGHNMAINETEKSHERATTPPEHGHTKATAVPERENLENHHVGFYPSDWKALERLANAQGGNVAVLIRRAIRDLLAREGFKD